MDESAETPAKLGDRLAWATDWLKDFRIISATELIHSRCGRTVDVGLFLYVPETGEYTDTEDTSVNSAIFCAMGHLIDCEAEDD